jgi:arginine deiminase
MHYDSSSETGKIAGLLLKHPKDAFRSQEYIDDHWQEARFAGRPDFQKACREFDRFSKILEQAGAEIHLLPGDEEAGLDSLYVRDPALVTRQGAILGRMGKREREGEPAAMGRFFARLGIPILGRIQDPGKLEGGDVVWLDEKTLAVGVGYRSNAEAVRQLKGMAAGLIKDIIEVHLPHWNGEGECLHLMSMLSPIDRDLAVVYSRMMPVTFRNYLKARGLEFIEVPDEEYDSMACNVLALAPRRCLMLAGNPRTRSLLEAAGVEVQVYEGEDLSLKGCGGPTCLTRPLWRQH